MKSNQLNLSFILTTVFFTVVGIFAANTQGYVKQQDYDPASYALQSRFIPHSEIFTMFYTKVILNRNLTDVVLPYKLPTQQNQILFLGFQSQNSNKPYERLLAHPQITNLNWELLSTESVRLYQKQPQYNSVEEFLANPPDVNRIAADPYLISQHSLDEATALNRPIDLNTVDFILTTYQPSTRQADAYLYQTTIDTSQAALNQHNEIQWFVRAPLASEENPYELGNIQVEFIQ